MSQERIQVNCLVQVLGNNELDFCEWVDYHIALGFDTIYVFDAGEKPWLQGVCTRRKNHVVLVPSSDAPEGKWEYKSDIIQTYVSRRTAMEWCVCLEDNEFLWIGPRAFRGVRDYVSSMPGDAMACTLYTKVMSSKEPTKYRVGTQIDCFTHTRRDPEGFLPAYGFLPNGGVTIFRIVNGDMPLISPVIPKAYNHWYDASFRRMTPDRYNEEIASRKFSPMSYPARCYKFGIRSGIEMEFKDDAVPRGFDVLDLNLQSARERMLHIPVNPETETMFAKTEPAQNTAIVESTTGEKVEVDADRAAEMALPISRARIDKMILKGEYFEDICEYVASKDPNYDKAALERVFNHERENIIKTSLPYTELQELVDQGVDDREIMKRLVLTPSTLERMKKVLPVLDIRAETGSADSVDPEVAIAVAVFDDKVSDGAMTESQKAEVDVALAARERPKKSTKKKTKKPAASKKRDAGKAKDTAEPAPKVSLENASELDDLIASVDLGGILANVEAHDEG